MFHSDTHIDLQQPGPKDNGPKITKNAVLASLAVSLGSMIGAKYLDFSTLLPSKREKNICISFAQFVNLLSEVCLLFNS